MLILFNSNMLPITKPAYEVHAPAVLPTLCAANLLPTFRISVFALKLLVQATLINIDPLFIRYFGQCV